MASKLNRSYEKLERSASVISIKSIQSTNNNSNNNNNSSSSNGYFAVSSSSSSSSAPIFSKALGGHHDYDYQNVNQTKRAGIASSVFNLTNTIIGGGVLSLPFAFNVFFILLFLFSFFFFLFSFFFFLFSLLFFLLLFCFSFLSFSFLFFLFSFFYLEITFKFDCLLCCHSKTFVIKFQLFHQN